MIPATSDHTEQLFDGIAPDWASLGILFLASLGMIAVATLIFKRLEPAFAKVI